MARFVEPTIVQQHTFGNLRWITLQSSDLAADIHAGQYVLVRCADPTSSDPLLRRALFVAGTDRDAGTVTLLYTPDERGTRWLAGQRADTSLDVFGPLGKPFSVDRRTRNLLLVGAGPGLGALLLLAHQAIQRGAAVVLLAAANEADLLPPPFLLPTAVEYQSSAEGDAALFTLLETKTQADEATQASADQPGRVTTSPPHLVTSSLISWADQLYATLPETLIPALAASVRAARLRWPRDFAQVLLTGDMPCGSGACLACLVETRNGLRTRCKDGPVFDLRDV